MDAYRTRLRLVGAHPATGVRVRMGGSKTALGVGGGKRPPWMTVTAAGECVVCALGWTTITCAAAATIREEQGASMMTLMTDSDEVGGWHEPKPSVPFTDAPVSWHPVCNYNITTAE